MFSTSHVLATAETLLRYREEEFLCDTVLVAKDRELKAHSILLAAVSPIFRSAFCSGAFPGRMFQVDLPDVDSAVLETALDFIYTGNLVLPSLDYASEDSLSVFFSTLQDLGLDLDKLNGCEMQFKSKDLNKKSVTEETPATFIKSEKDIEEAIEVSAAGDASSHLKHAAGVPWKESLGKRGKFLLNTDPVNLDEADKSVVVSEDLLNDLVGGEHCYDATQDEGDEDGAGDEDTEMGDMDDTSDGCILVQMNNDNGAEPQYVVVMPQKHAGTNETTPVPTVGSGSVHRCTQLTHGSANNRPHECAVCHRRFTHKYHLWRHEKQHSSSQQHVCHFCGDSFVQKASLEDHVRQKHSNNSTGDAAGTTTLDTTASSLDSSLLEFPSIISADDLNPNRPFLCDICGKNFSTALSLKLHGKLHSGERPFACQTCDKAFVQKIQLIQHEQRHLGVRPYACDQCSRTFAQKGQLTQHLRVHTGVRPFVCECGSAFPAKAMLTAHRRLHTGERPHVCGTCGKDFAYKESLVVHMRTHTGEKPFECSVCGSRYTQSHHLKGHMRTHTGEKPFSCHLCDKTYKNRVDLRFHCARVHNVNISKRNLRVEPLPDLSMSAGDISASFEVSS